MIFLVDKWSYERLKSIDSVCTILDCCVLVAFFVVVVLKPFVTSETV